MDHLGAGIGLLMPAGERHRVKLADGVIPAQDAARVFPGNGRAGFRLGPGHLAVFAFAQRALGDKVQDAAGIAVAREPVLHRGVFHLSVFVDDDLHHRRVQLIAVAYRGGTALNIADVAAFIGHQNGTFKLAGFFRVDTEISRQLHRATYAFWYVNKGAVGGHRRVERREEIIVRGYHGPNVLFHQFRVVVNRFAEGAENDPLLCQLLAVGGRHRDGVENGVHRHLSSFANGHAKLIKGFFNFFAQEAIFCAGLLYRTRLRGAGVVTAAAGGRGVVAVILIVQLVVVRFQPVRLFHFQPGAEGAQTKFQHPLRFITFGRDRPNDIFVDAFRQLIGLQLREAAAFVLGFRVMKFE